MMPQDVQHSGSNQNKTKQSVQRETNLYICWSAISDISKNAPQNLVLDCKDEVFTK